MADVLRIALERRRTLNNEIDQLDGFIRMAEELITASRQERPAGEVDFFQSRFNSGEVLPPLAAGDDSAGPIPIR